MANTRVSSQQKVMQKRGTFQLILYSHAVLTKQIKFDPVGPIYMV